MADNLKDVDMTVETYNRGKIVIVTYLNRNTTEAPPQSSGDDHDHIKPNQPELKPNQPENPEVTVAEAAAKINASDLAAFLAKTSASYESKQHIQVKLFADYFDRVFASVSATQFPWLKIFGESSFGKIVDIPISHISNDVYKTSVDWLNQISCEALGPFVLRSLDKIFSDMDKSRKVVQQPQKSRAAIFVVLATVVRQKPDVLISLLPVMAKDPKYQVHQDKQKITIWLVAQAFEGNLIVGLFMWVHLLLPMLSYSNRQNRCLILKLMERILSVPKARSVLLNGVVWNGERVVPPWALELLMRIAFPVYLKDKVKATQRFEAVYRTLKKIALACSPGSKEMKQITGEILQFAIKAVGEHKCIHGLTDEATNIFIWCLTQNQDCYKQWEDLYLDNIEASVYILDKLYNGWEEHSVKHCNLQSLKTSLKSFRQTNSEALAIRENEYLTYAEAYCKLISKRLSWFERISGRYTEWFERISRRYTEALGFVLLAAGAGGAAIMYRNIQLLFTMT